MAKLIVTRGLPSSGKSTRAIAWVAEDPLRRARVNRDDIRSMLHGGYLGEHEQEIMTTKVANAAITSLLAKGVDVVADNTTLPTRHARDLRRLAVLAGAEFEVWDMTDVPLEVCLDRDANRENSVGGAVIHDMYNRFIKGKGHPLPLPEEEAADTSGNVPYVADASKPKAVLVDIDGTVALLANRSPYDETKVHMDKPNWPVIANVRALARAGYKIVFLSGRTHGCREETIKWLQNNVLEEFDGPFMRPAGDMRKDSVVKYELFDKHVRNNYNIKFSLDDRDQVVKAWRALGLTVFQVSEGNF